MATCYHTVLAAFHHCSYSCAPSIVRDIVRCIYIRSYFGKQHTAIVTFLAVSACRSIIHTISQLVVRCSYYFYPSAFPALNHHLQAHH